jgi:DNA repair protein RAD50
MNVRRYIREKRSRQLKDCEQRITEHESRVSQLTADLESTRNTIVIIDKEVNESNASMTNLRENIRVRKLVRDIGATQAEIDAMDMEEAAKARRQFDLKYNLEKQRETEMQSKVRRAPFLHYPEVHHVRSPVCPYRRRTELAKRAGGDART